MGEHIITEKIEKILRIEIHRPERRNAISSDEYAGIAKAINEGEQDPSIRVMVIHGQKDYFSAGNDFKEITIKIEPVRDYADALIKCKKPLIGAVNGYAIGIGMTMLLHCDLVYAGESAIFRAPFVDLALCPDIGSTYILPRLVGHQKASEIFLLCEDLSSEEAYRLGLINKVFPDDELLERVLEIAKKLSEKPPGSVRLTKDLLKKNLAEIVETVRTDEVINMAKRMRSRESREIIKAKMEKRKPDFSKFK